MSNYKENAEYVKKILDEENLHYDMRNDEQATIFIGDIGGFKGLYNSFRFIVAVCDDEAQCFAIFPASAKEKLAQVAEFITRANYRLKYGEFQMNYNDGEIRFHLTFPMVALRADRDLIPTLIGYTTRALSDFSKGLTEVLMDLKTPEEAVAACLSELT